MMAKIAVHFWPSLHCYQGIIGLTSGSHQIHVASMLVLFVSMKRAIWSLVPVECSQALVRSNWSPVSAKESEFRIWEVSVTSWVSYRNHIGSETLSIHNK